MSGESEHPTIEQMAKEIAGLKSQVSFLMNESKRHATAIMHLERANRRS